MFSFIRTHTMFLASLCCVHTQLFRSSYFKISSQESLDEVEDFSFAIDVHDEYNCASECTSTAECQYALFEEDSRKCSLVKATEKLKRPKTEMSQSGKILLEKVSTSLQTPYL